NHMCAKQTNGTLWCWGWNAYGQLGDGTIVQRLAPVQVTSLGTSVASASIGAAHSCVLKNDGTVWCWGFNGEGEVGDGTTTTRSPPTWISFDTQSVPAAPLPWMVGAFLFLLGAGVARIRTSRRALVSSMSAR